MKGTLRWIRVVSMAVGLCMVAGCDVGGGGVESGFCVYDEATDLCQQTYRCCNQYLAWAQETGQPIAELLDCEGYTCVGMQDTTCQEFIDQALMAEEAYQQDWPDCN